MLTTRPPKPLKILCIVRAESTRRLKQNSAVIICAELMQCTEKDGNSLLSRINTSDRRGFVINETLTIKTMNGTAS
jgi:hypothetical protein